jgi:hypothetical protein
VDFSKPNNFFPESMSFVTKPKVGPNVRESQLRNLKINKKILKQGIVKFQEIFYKVRERIFFLCINFFINYKFKNNMANKNKIETNETQK